MTILSEKFFRDDTNPNRIVQTGLHISLQNSMIDPERDLIVRADTVVIMNRLVLPGRLVHLFARQVHCEHGAWIDVSGAKGEPDYTGMGQADGGDLKGAGQPGEKGDDGGDGKDAGEIKIVARDLTGRLTLLAKGGDGGAAQDGGEGAKGKRGKDGRRNVGRGRVSEANAGNGHQGGRAGNAGVPGKGGDGGLIVVSVFNGLADRQVTTNVAKGRAGTMGKPGEPGSGGDPGTPGNYDYRVWDP